VAQDEAFWADVRSKFVLRTDVLNLDHGWTNPTTKSALESLTTGARVLEELPAEELPRMWDEISTTTVRQALATAMRVPAAEIAIARNATEALNTVLLGLPMRAGDEIVCSAHDYYAMLDALEQRRARDGVILRMVRPPLPAPSMDALASLYEAELNTRTRLVLLTHPSNLTGQLLPVSRIAAAAHSVGAEVIVDGAQSLGLLDSGIRELDVDYYGASAHKWLSTPVGMGVLWMRPEHVSKVWPAVPPPPDVKAMERFEWIGTSASYIEPSSLPALALHETIGAARKSARIRYLHTHLRNRMSQAFPKVRFYTIDDPAMSIGLTHIEIAGLDMAAVQKALRKQHGILTQSMGGNARTPEIRSLRISPNVYTTPTEIDRFADAMISIARA
jgi:selenocysteine lyase/cysteine desulfurase